jgi:hypothetical protein
MRILANASPFGVVEFPIEVDPQTRAAELTKVMVHRLPRRKMGRQIAPWAAGAHQIKERIKDAPQ